MSVDLKCLFAAARSAIDFVKPTNFCWCEILPWIDAEMNILKTDSRSDITDPIIGILPPV